MGGQRDTLQYPWGYHNCPYLDSITWGYDIHGSTRDNEIPNRWIFGASFRCTQIYPNIISSWLQYIYSIYIYTIIKLVTVYIYIWYCKAISFGWCSKGKCRPVSVTNRPIMQAMLLRIAGGYVPGVEAGPQVTDVARLFVHSSWCFVNGFNETQHMYIYIYIHMYTYIYTYTYYIYRYNYIYTD